MISSYNRINPHRIILALILLLSFTLLGYYHHQLVELLTPPVMFLGAAGIGVIMLLCWIVTDRYRWKKLAGSYLSQMDSNSHNYWKSKDQYEKDLDTAKQQLHRSKEEARKLRRSLHNVLQENRKLNSRIDRLVLEKIFNSIKPKTNNDGKEENNASK
jgi:hypothetical protein